LHALAAVRGGLRSFELEGHGDVAAAPAGGGKVAQRLGKAVDRHQAAFVVQGRAGQRGEARMYPGRAAVGDGVAHHAVKVWRCVHVSFP